MLAIVLGLASSLSWGVSDFIGGVQSRRLPVISVLVVSQPVGLVLAVGVALVAGGNPLPGGEAALAAAAGAIGALALGAFYLAMAGGAVSIVAPIASMGVIVPVVVGLLRGEQPAAIQVGGLIVALLGIVLAAREAEHPHALPVPARSLLLAAMAGLGFGTFFVCIDSAAAHNAAWATVAARGGGVALILIAALGRRGSLVFSRSALPALLAIGVLDILANDLFAFATRSGLLSLVAVAASLYPVATVLLARVVLGERLAPVQQAGVALALGGVAMIAAGV
jgi:drug/metabolite transporter (DMT)-like permease